MNSEEFKYGMIIKEECFGFGLKRAENNKELCGESMKIN
jgi:hypothetical protein